LKSRAHLRGEVNGEGQRDDFVQILDVSMYEADDTPEYALSLVSPSLVSKVLAIYCNAFYTFGQVL
jgi:hypothetical protein